MGTNIYSMRIDNDVDLFNAAAPIGTFDAVGIGSQFDAAVPLDSGYFFMPRYTADIIYTGDVLIVNNDNAETDIETAVVINVDGNDFYPNTVTSFTITAQPGFGTAVITSAANYEITYTPEAGYCGPDAFTYQVCDGGGCQEGTVSIEVTCVTGVPMYDIGQINTENANGVADSLGVICQTVGTVYGVNMRATGLQFTIIDDNGEGIGVFSSSADFGYSVTEGDLVIVSGTVAQFNGFTQMEATNVEFVIGGNQLVTPQVVTQLDESTESQLVKINNLTLVDAAQWTNAGSGFNVDVTNGSNTFQMRVDADTDVFGTSAPTVAFNLTGLGGQFDSTDPFTGGYQLLPRYIDDIDLLGGVAVLGDPSLVKLSPNPASVETIVTSSVQPDKIEIMTMTGMKVMEISSPSQIQALSVRDLPSGVYNIRCYFDNLVVNKQLVKL